MPYFHFPQSLFPNNAYYYKTNHYKNFSNKHIASSKIESNRNCIISNETKKNNSKNNDAYFFELFGLKLYFDDVLLICLIFFLYQEGVKDEELFISLILLLLS